MSITVLYLLQGQQAAGSLLTKSPLLQKAEKKPLFSEEGGGGGGHFKKSYSQLYEWESKGF